MDAVGDYKVYETIELLVNHSTALLDNQCYLAKDKRYPFGSNG